nr:type II toxin-antitoxin system ParD family antitoxin [Rhizobium leguminosarum]
MTGNAKTYCLGQASAEKISAVEGPVLSPRMRKLLAETKDQPAEERRQAIRAQFARKEGATDEIMREKIREAIDDPGSDIDADTVFARFDRLHAERMKTEGGGA